MAYYVNSCVRCLVDKIKQKVFQSHSSLNCFVIRYLYMIIFFLNVPKNLFLLDHHQAVCLPITKNDEVLKS